MIVLEQAASFLMGAATNRARLTSMPHFAMDSSNTLLKPHRVGKLASNFSLTPGVLK
jgi:hypothetical protein